MATHAKPRQVFRLLHSFSKTRAVGHQRRRSHDSVRMSFDDSPVHARRVAKIICIDDQTPHAASLAGCWNAACRMLLQSRENAQTRRMRNTKVRTTGNVV